jgi:hypothetical protein
VSHGPSRKEFEHKKTDRDLITSQLTSVHGGLWISKSRFDGETL